MARRCRRGPAPTWTRRPAPIGWRILTFDGRARWLIGFEQWAALPPSKRARGRRRPAGGAGARLGRDRPGARRWWRRPRRVADDAARPAGACSPRPWCCWAIWPRAAGWGRWAPADWPAGVRLRVERLEPATARRQPGPAARARAPPTGRRRSGTAAACGVRVHASGASRRIRHRANRRRAPGAAGLAGRRAAARSRWCCPRARRRCWTPRRARPGRPRWSLEGRRVRLRQPPGGRAPASPGRQPHPLRRQRRRQGRDRAAVFPQPGLPGDPHPRAPGRGPAAGRSRRCRRRSPAPTWW